LPILTQLGAAGLPSSLAGASLPPGWHVLPDEVSAR
jgi:hypothetical protein